jgi:cytochrome c oxidase subunit II
MATSMIWRAARAARMTGILLLASNLPCLAQDSTPAPYLVCAGCHGARGEGNAAVNAPPLAGQSAEYLARQLTKFRNGQRAYLQSDAAGQVMKAVAQSLHDDAAIQSVAKIIAMMPPGQATAAAAPPPRNKQVTEIFTACASCHGARGEGRADARAPNLAQLPAWYLTKALQDFRSGARGTMPGDLEGHTMRTLVRLIPDDQALRELAAYVDAL